MKTPYVYTFCTLYIFRVYFLFIFLPLYLCFASIKQIEQVEQQIEESDRISVPPDYIKHLLLYEHVMNLLKKKND